MKGRKVSLRTTALDERRENGVEGWRDAVRTHSSVAPASQGLQAAVWTEFRRMGREEGCGWEYQRGKEELRELLKEVEKVEARLTIRFPRPVASGRVNLGFGRWLRWEGWLSLVGGRLLEGGAAKSDGSRGLRVSTTGDTLSTLVLRESFRVLEGPTGGTGRERAEGAADGLRATGSRLRWRNVR